MKITYIIRILKIEPPKCLLPILQSCQSCRVSSTLLFGWLPLPLQSHQEDFRDEKHVQHPPDLKKKCARSQLLWMVAKSMVAKWILTTSQKTVLGKTLWPRGMDGIAIGAVFPIATQSLSCYAPFFDGHRRSREETVVSLDGKSCSLISHGFCFQALWLDCMALGGEHPFFWQCWIIARGVVITHWVAAATASVLDCVPIERILESGWGHRGSLPFCVPQPSFPNKCGITWWASWYLSEESSAARMLSSVVFLLLSCLLASVLQGRMNHECLASSINRGIEGFGVYQQNCLGFPLPSWVHVGNSSAFWSL